MPELPHYSPFYTFCILLMFMTFRYLLLGLLFKAYIHFFSVPAISARPVNQQHIKRDILWSLSSTVVFAAIGTLTIEFWHKGALLIYSGDAYPMWYIPFSLLLYLFVHDSYFYWSHRWMHRNLKLFHYAHHESRRPTVWTSFSFHPLEALIQAIILPLLLMTIPIHWVVLVFFLLLMSLFGVTNHLGHEIYPRYLEKRFFLITARHHQSHHERINSNFGLYFTFWDHLMKTEEKGQS